MSYPPASYHGHDGEISATLRTSDADPEIHYARGGTCGYLATGKSTNGRFGLYRWDFGDGESGPEPHFHRSISESFFVLSGTVRLFNGDGWLAAGAGDFLFVPEGGIHAFRGSERASMLLLFAPGAPREEYFETLSRVGQGQAMSEDERAEFMLRHDSYWL